MVSSLAAALARVSSRGLLRPGIVALQSVLLCMFQFSEVHDQYSGKRENVYNILWVLVFGFATLNILGLVARRLEPSRNRFSFGEALAIMVVVVSVVLLSYELLTVFKIFPIRLHSH